MRDSAPRPVMICGMPFAARHMRHDSRSDGEMRSDEPVFPVPRSSTMRHAGGMTVSRRLTLIPARSFLCLGGKVFKETPESVCAVE